MSRDQNELRPFATLPRGLSPLGYRDFALYWVGLATTSTGRWAELTGLVWLVYELTGSPLLVGLLGAARALPNLILSPIAGVLADRTNPRMILYVTQGAGLLASLCLGILITTGHLELWHIYAQVLAQAAITAFDAAARQTLFPRLVPRTIVPKAVTLAITATRVAKFVGPVIGGLLIAEWGVSSPFYVNAASFLGLMFALAFMRETSRPARTGAAVSFRGELVEGMRYVFTDRVMLGLFIVEIVFGLFQVNPALVAIIGRELLDLGPRALGLLLAAPALGSSVGIVWLVSTERIRRYGRFSLCSTLVYAVVLAFLAHPSGFPFVFVLLAAIGALEVVLSVTRNTIMQLAAPDHMRGRVMSTMGLVTRGIGPFAETQSGALAVLVGPQLAILTAATAIGLVAGLTAYLNRTLWRFTF